VFYFLNRYSGSQIGDMADWFSALANQALKLADDFTDSLVAQANEAQDELVREQSKLKEEAELKQQQLSTLTQLPWETQDESLQILSEDLMEMILKLSLNEQNFTHEAPNSDEIIFVFSDFVATALQLLKLDANLAHVHSKISPKMDEEIFWRNYYCRVIYLRAKSGIDGSVAQDDSAKWDSKSIIFEPSKRSNATTDTSALLQSQSSSGAKGSRGGSSKLSSSQSASHAHRKQSAYNGNDEEDEDMDLEISFGDEAEGSAVRGKQSAGQDDDEGGDLDLNDLDDDEDMLDLGDLDADLDLLGELAEELRLEQEEEAAAGAAAGTAGGAGTSSSGEDLGASASSSGSSRGIGATAAPSARGGGGGSGSSGGSRVSGGLGSSYEDISKSDCNSNAELEAQIAAELAQELDLGNSDDDDDDDN
jgi:hypothetical protein